MFWITITLAFAAAAATLFYLIRGLVAFLRTTAESLNEDGVPALASAQNKAMQGRVTMQAIAIALALMALVLLSS